MVLCLQPEGNLGINRKSGIHQWTNVFRNGFVFVTFMIPRHQIQYGKSALDIWSRVWCLYDSVKTRAIKKCCRKYFGYHGFHKVY